MLTRQGVLFGKVLCEYPTASWLTSPYTAAGITVLLMTILAITLPTSPANHLPHINVAFIGNSMQYYNDLPRLLETLANGKMTQNSCLHGGASLSSILVWGNGMGNKWHTGTARIGNDEYGDAIYDYGACTVPQLLFGYDTDLNERDNAFHSDQKKDGDDDAVTDDGNMKNLYNQDVDDFFSYYDGSNPCLLNENYLPYLQNVFYYPSESSSDDDDNNNINININNINIINNNKGNGGRPPFDFVVMNDNTRSPARNDTRQEGIQILTSHYIPWFLQMNNNTNKPTIPVFISTYGYWTKYRDMGGLIDIPTFTSYTHEGYIQYASLMAAALPASQKPRIAPVSLAFLLVWEEKYHVWERLFHVDYIHPSPSGTYLQALVIYYTLYGKMPEQSIALRQDIANLWYNARRFQPREHRRLPFPTIDEAQYLYNVAVRICVYQYLPKSLIIFNNNKDEESSAATYIPNDDVYKIDDLF